MPLSNDTKNDKTLMRYKHLTHNTAHGNNMTWMGKTLLTLICCCTNLASQAQEGKTGYQFLHIPASAHNAALGGANISIVEDDASMMWTNAAMLTNVSDKTLTLGYNSYIESSNVFTAGFVKAIGERGTWALGAQMLDYGDMDETDETGQVTGSFSLRL